MAKSVNYESKVVQTKDGAIRYGHIHSDQVKSSVMLQGQGGLEYITIDQTAPRKGWISTRARGRYQVVCGDNIPKGQPGMYFDAASGDIVIKTKGRIRIEAENIDMIAKGSDGSNGNITLDGNESISLISKKVEVTADEVCNIMTDGTLQMSAINIMKMYGGSIEKLTGVGVNLLKTTVFPSTLNLPFKI